MRPDLFAWGTVVSSGGGKANVDVHGEVYEEVPVAGHPVEAGDVVPTGFVLRDSQRMPVALGLKAKNAPRKLIVKTKTKGDGQWVTPEADFLNSRGLTVASKWLRFSTPHVLNTLFATARWGSDPWGAIAMYSEPLGQVAFTVKVPSGTATYLATFWVNFDGGWYGTNGTITETVIQGQFATTQRTINFGTNPSNGINYETLEGDSFFRERRQGFLFVDVVTKDTGIYVLPLRNTGIYVIDRATGSAGFTPYPADANRGFTRGGSVSCYGKFAVECGYTGWDHSDQALEQYSSLIDFRDPINIEGITLPDHAGRGKVWVYTRKDDLTFDSAAVDLKAVTPNLMRILGCGCFSSDTQYWHDTSTDEYVAYASPYTPSWQRILSHRFPWILEKRKDPLVMIQTSVMTKVKTFGDPGLSMWQLLSLNPNSKEVKVVNQKINKNAPMYAHPGWLEERRIAYSIESAASILPGNPEGSPWGATTNRTENLTTDGNGDPVVFEYQTVQRTRGWKLEAIDEFRDGDTNAFEFRDAFLMHPLAGDVDEHSYNAISNLIGLGYDSWASITSPLNCSGVVDGYQRHFCVVSEPIPFVNRLQRYEKTDNLGNRFYELLSQFSEYRTVYWYYGAKGAAKQFHDYFHSDDDPYYAAGHGGAPMDQAAFDANNPPGNDYPELLLQDGDITASDALQLDSWFSPSVWPVWEVNIRFDSESNPIPPVFNTTDGGDYINPTILTLTPFQYETKLVYAVINRARQLSDWNVYKTWLICSKPNGGDSFPPIDITQYLSWPSSGTSDPSRIDSAVNYPALLNVWCLEVIAERWAFMVRQLNWKANSSGVITSDLDLQFREPHLDIWDLKSLSLVKRVSLHPPTDVARSLSGFYENVPKMIPGITAEGFPCATIWTTWMGASFNREQVAQAITEVCLRGNDLERHDSLFTGKKQAGRPLSMEVDTMVINNGRAYWIEDSASIVEQVQQ